MMPTARLGCKRAVMAFGRSSYPRYNPRLGRVLRDAGIRSLEQSAISMCRNLLGNADNALQGMCANGAVVVPTVTM